MVPSGKVLVERGVLDRAQKVSVDQAHSPLTPCSPARCASFIAAVILWWAFTLRRSTAPEMSHCTCMSTSYMNISGAKSQDWYIQSRAQILQPVVKPFWQWFSNQR